MTNNLMTETTLKTFRSLNCSLCNTPFEKSLTGHDPKSPYQLLCGQAICRECWEKEQPLDKEERKHKCDGEEDCYHTRTYANSLQDLLSNPSIIKSLNGNGHLLTEPLADQAIKCFYCGVNYSINPNENELLLTTKGRIVCIKCFDEWQNKKIPPWQKRMAKTSNSWLTNFLLELPSMLEQIPEVRKTEIILKTFQSLNCTLCNTPFSKTGPPFKTYPHQLHCGQAICRECWRQEERKHNHWTLEQPLDKVERKHKCDFEEDCYHCDEDCSHCELSDSSNLLHELLETCGKCWRNEGRLKKEMIHKYDFEEDCYRCDGDCYRCDFLDYPYFIQELLNNSSIIEYPNGNGWLLSESFAELTKCCHCGDVAFVSAGGLICSNCCIKEKSNSWLKNFFQELPSMLEQIPKVKEVQMLVNQAKIKLVEAISIPEKSFVGEGAYGRVYKLDGHYPRAVIKCVDEAQLHGELETLKKLTHTNIVALLYRVPAKLSTKFGIVMEFCERKTLKETISNPKIIYSIMMVIGWGEELFGALDYMFRKHEVVHRDIKPDNIFVNEEFVLKIGDFGCIKYTEQTCSGSFLGNERYMSPPEFDGYKETIQDSHRNDVYSMALVLWETIERRIVFSEYNNEEGHFVRSDFISDLYHKKIIELTPPNCQPELQEIIARCTNFDRSLRPVASDVHEGLERFRLLEFPRDLDVEAGPLEEENQKEIIRPLGFNGTMDRIPIETSKNSFDDLDLDFNVTLS